MKKTLFLIIMFGVFGHVQAQVQKPWEQATREHFRRMDSLNKARQQDLLNDLRLVPVNDTVVYRQALAKALENYADNWDYYFYTEMQRYKAALGLNAHPPVENKEVNGIVEIIRIIKDMKEEEEENGEEEKEVQHKPAKPAPSGKHQEKKSGKKKKRRISTASRIDWGMNNMDVAPGPTSYNTWKSQFVALGMETDFPIDRKDILHYRLGFGFRWQKLVPTGNYFHTVNNGTTFLTLSTVNLSRNKLRTSWFYGNTGFLIHPARKFSIGFEVYGRVRLGSVQKLSYTKDDAAYRVREKRNFYEQKFNYGGNVFIGGRHWQVYAGMDNLPYFEHHNGRMYQLGITLR